MQLLLKPYIRSLEQTILFKIIRQQPYLAQRYPFFDFYNHPHLSIAQAKSILPETIFDNQVKFGVVRHPVDWIISVFKHWQRIYHLDPNKTKTYRAVKTLEDFVLFRLDHYVPIQALQFIDKAGVLQLDHVGNFAHLNLFAESMTSILNIEGSLQRINVAPSKQKYIPSKKDISLIEKACRLDFELFDFDQAQGSGFISVKKNKGIEVDLATELEKAGGNYFDPWIFAPSMSKDGFLVPNERLSKQ